MKQTMSCMTTNETTCGCCEGTALLTPMTVANRPGLDTLAYRVGIHATFLATMKARLSQLHLPDGVDPLRKLTTRAESDPAIALLDAWAIVADVLTFYQERIANEGYLPTATERRSILELANLIGYKLRPGVAASTFLAFTLEQGHEVEIPAGTRAQSLPGPGELPQPFETSEPLLARAEWNAIKPRLLEPQLLSENTTTAYLATLQTNLKPDDPVLVVAAESGKATPYFRRVHSVKLEAKAERSTVLLTGDLVLTKLSALLATQPTIATKQVGAPEGLRKEELADGTIKLDWNPSQPASGETVYTVYLGQANKSELKPVAVNITDTFYTLAEFEPSTAYNWRVTVKDEISEASSPEQSFSTPALEGNATLPAANARGVSLSPSLRWRGEADVRYTVVYAPASGVLPTIILNGNKTDRSLTALAHATTYYWRVIGINRDKEPVEIVPTRTFTTGTQPSAAQEEGGAADAEVVAAVETVSSTDADNLTNISINPTLQWTTAVSNIERYVLLYGTDADAVSRAMVNLADPRLALKDLQPNTDYVWRVLDARNSERVARRSFRTLDDTGPLHTPQPTDYALDVEIQGQNNTVQLRWTSTMSGATYTVAYGIDRTNLANSRSAGNATNIELPNLTPGTRYYWQVTARVGTADPVSGPLWHFTTQGLTPDDRRRQQAGLALLGNLYRRFVEDDSVQPEVSGSTPQVNVSTTPILRWNGNAADTYELLIDTIQPPRQIVAARVTGLSYQPDKPLESYTVYYWGVRPSGVSSFLVQGEFTTANLPLLDRLRNPDLATAILRTYVDLEKPALARDQATFAKYTQSPLFAYPKTSLDFSALLRWFNDLETELANVSGQLDLRRLDLGGPERVFTDKLIEESAVAEIAAHLQQKPQLATGLDIDSIAQPALDQLATDASALAVILITPADTDDEKVAAVLKEVYRISDTYQILKALGNATGWVSALRALLEQNVITQIAPLESRSTRGLANLVENLTNAPPSQPAGTLRLVRDISDVLGTNADLTTRLLTTFRPELQGTFYEAWAQTDFTPVSPLQSVEALRVRAIPLGARAALMPLYDDERNIIGHREWPLLAMSVELRFGSIWRDGPADNPDHYHWPLQITMTLTREAEAMQETRKIDEFTTLVEFSLHGLTVRVRLTPSTQHGLDRVNIDVMGEEVLQLRMRNLNEADNQQELKIGDYIRPFSIDAPAGPIIDNIHGQPVTIRNNFTADQNQEQLFIIENLSVPIPNVLLTVLTLDAEYDKVTPGSWIVIERTGQLPAAAQLRAARNDATAQAVDRTIYRVVRVETVSKPNYGKVTQLTLNQPWLQKTDRSLALLRTMIIYLQSERLPLAEQTKQETVGGNEIILDDLYDGLAAGRWFIIAGERTDVPGATGVRASELVLIGGVKHVIQQDANGNDIPGDTPHTQVILAGDGLTHTYKRDTVIIYGNVVKATHGESRNEVLGSGNGRQARQSFTLKQAPLTYVAAPTIDGIQSTLEVRVNNVRWHEADDLFWLEANDRGFITMTGDDDKTRVIFGDGQHGARLPTGIENIKAVYRSGIGRVGNVAAERISLLAAKPLGVKEVINPLRASGGADRERRDQARQNAPLAVVALDRLVSLSDYADFTRTYAGVGKASAVKLINGRRELIHITMAGADDIPIDKTSDLYQGLYQTLHMAGTLPLSIQLDLRELLLILISARVRLLTDYLWEPVAQQIRAALLARFSFARRDLGQAVLLSEVISTIQGVPGVAYVDVDILDAIHENTPPQELETLATVLTTDQDQPLKRIPLQLAQVQSYHTVMRNNETYLSIAARYADLSPVALQSWNDPQKPLDEPFTKGDQLTLNSRRIRPAQLAYLSPDLPDMLILKEVTA